MMRNYRRHITNFPTRSGSNAIIGLIIVKIMALALVYYTRERRPDIRKADVEKVLRRLVPEEWGIGQPLSRDFPQIRIMKIDSLSDAISFFLDIGGELYAGNPESADLWYYSRTRNGEYCLIFTILSRTYDNTVAVLKMIPGSDKTLMIAELRFVCTVGSLPTKFSWRARCPQFRLSYDVQ